MTTRETKKTKRPPVTSQKKINGQENENGISKGTKGSKGSKGTKCSKGSKGTKCSKGSNCTKGTKDTKGTQNRKRQNSVNSTSPLTEEYQRNTRKSNKYFGREETQYSIDDSYERSTLPSRSTMMSSLTGYSTGSDRTETDPGEFYEKWKLRDDKAYDTDETYLTSPGSKYTSRNNL